METIEQQNILRTEHIGPRSTKRRLTNPIRVRVSPGSYIAAVFFLSFVSAFLFYLDNVLVASVGLTVAWVILPLLWFFDRISFDGRRLFRTGLLPVLWARANSSRTNIKLADVEQVDSQALRTFRRSGSVVYRYKTTFRGMSVAFSVSSGGMYRQLIRAVLPMLNEDVLDHRSLELREYLCDPNEVRLRANRSKIPSAEVLEGSLKDFRKKKRQGAVDALIANAGEKPKADELRRLGNELRVSGALLRSAEAFRRALIYSPNDSRLLFEFAHCLQSLAGAERDHRIERRAIAMVRLAERRAANDEELLGRIGEFYFQIGDWDRAASVFKRAVDAMGRNFRAFRGLAEIALREGKIAHVIHNFASANALARSTALRRWTKVEVEYFSRLHDDDEYMELEISRVNLLDSLDRAKKTSLRIGIAGIPMIILGVAVEDVLIANIGWAVSMVACFFWLVIGIGRRMLESRIPFDMIEDGDSRNN